MRPQVLDRIELWRVGRQEFELYAAAFALDVISHEAAVMGLPTIPNDEELAAKEAKLPRRERRSTQRLFEELRGRGYDRA